MEDKKLEENFKPKPFWKEIAMKKEDLADYYNAKRAYNYEQGKATKNMRWRKIIQPFIIKLMELDRKIVNKQTFEVLNNEQIDSDKPVIYAVTHIGKFDYQIISEVIRKHQIPFTGDPEVMYRTTDGYIMGLNGVIYCDTDNKEDRKTAYNTAVEYIKQGNNITIYPEGVWNITPNLLMLPLFSGVIKMAMETGVDIVPIAIEQYDNNFIINIGKNFEVPEPLSVTEQQREEYIELQKRKLRDEMAKLKWEIFESKEVEKRKDLGNYLENYQNFVNTRLNEWFDKKTGKNHYDEDIIYKRIYKEKSITLTEDAFSHLEKINLNKDNAFLIGKNIEYPGDISLVKTKK